MLNDTILAMDLGPVLCAIVVVMVVTRATLNLRY